MAFSYRLSVNQKFLGPFERRTIVGMRVKEIVTDEQLLYRSDGLELTVSQLMQDRLEAMAHQSAGHSVNSSVMCPSSVGMWPHFSVRLGGSPTKPGALGLSGNGQLVYQGDALLLKGLRLNNKLGMSKSEVRIALSAISTSEATDVVLTLWLHGGLDVPESRSGSPVRIEFVVAHEAAEVWDLLNIGAAQLMQSFVHTAHQAAQG